MDERGCLTWQSQCRVGEGLPPLAAHLCSAPGDAEVCGKDLKGSLLLLPLRGGPAASQPPGLLPQGCSSQSVWPGRRSKLGRGSGTRGCGLGSVTKQLVTLGKAFTAPILQPGYLSCSPISLGGSAPPRPRPALQGSHSPAPPLVLLKPPAFALEAKQWLERWLEQWLERWVPGGGLGSHPGLPSPAGPVRVFWAADTVTGLGLGQVYGDKACGRQNLEGEPQTDMQTPQRLGQRLARDHGAEMASQGSPC